MIGLLTGCGASCSAVSIISRDLLFLFFAKEWLLNDFFHLVRKRSDRFSRVTWGVFSCRESSQECESHDCSLWKTWRPSSSSSSVIIEVLLIHDCMCCVGKSLEGIDRNRPSSREPRPRDWSRHRFSSKLTVNVLEIESSFLWYFSQERDARQGKREVK